MITNATKNIKDRYLNCNFFVNPLFVAAFFEIVVAYGGNLRIRQPEK